MILHVVIRCGSLTRPVLRHTTLGFRVSRRSFTAARVAYLSSTRRPVCTPTAARCKTQWGDFLLQLEGGGAFPETLNRVTWVLEAGSAMHRSRQAVARMVMVASPGSFFCAFFVHAYRATDMPLLGGSHAPANGSFPLRLVFGMFAMFRSRCPIPSQDSDIHIHYIQERSTNKRCW